MEETPTHPPQTTNIRNIKEFQNVEQDNPITQWNGLVPYTPILPRI
jgi:hypothetical protein